MTEVQLKINGRPVRCDVEARTTLADFLREQLNLTSVHLGCEHGVCGACTIIVNGQPTRSCLALAIAADGDEIWTIEGLDNDEVIAVLRDSFHSLHGLQCGYCTPAMLVTARDLVLRGKANDESEIRQGLSGNICRCTGYTDIVASVRDAAERIAKKSNARVAS